MLTEKRKIKPKTKKSEEDNETTLKEKNFGIGQRQDRGDKSIKEQLKTVVKSETKDAKNARRRKRKRNQDKKEKTKETSSYKWKKEKEKHL